MALKPALSALTGIRFWAALYVVLFHYAGPVLVGAPLWAHRMHEAGTVGVDFFFLLSGFVLAYNYLDGRTYTRREFWLARFARIYPAYLLAILLIAPFTLQLKFAKDLPLLAAGKSAVDLGLLLTLTQAWIPVEALAWNSPAWSLSAEAFFYAMFPLAGLLLVRLRGRALAAALAGCWGLTLLSPLSYALPVPAAWWWWSRVGEFNPALRLPEFLFGLVLGRIFLTQVRVPRSGQLAGLTGAAILALLAFGPGKPGAPLLYTALLVPLFGLLVFCLAQGRGVLVRALSTPAMLILGEASYAVYILQVPVAAVLQAINGSLGGAPGEAGALDYFTSPALFVVYLVVLVAASVLCARLVEAPARRAIKRLGTRRSPIAEVGTVRAV